MISSKAVADGAISFYLDGHVTSRVSPITIGAPSGVPYNAFDPDHLRRTRHHRTLPSGKIVVTGGFEVVLEKVRVNEVSGLTSVRLNRMLSTGYDGHGRNRV